MKYYGYYEYTKFDGEVFFTIILLPKKCGCFPTVVCRSPYLLDMGQITEDEAVRECLISYASWLERGYAIVFQHCRGQGKSTGCRGWL